VFLIKTFNVAHELSIALELQKRTYRCLLTSKSSFKLFIIVLQLYVDAFSDNSKIASSGESSFEELEKRNIEMTQTKLMCNFLLR